MAGELALGWRWHSHDGVVVAVTGPASAPVVVHRETVTLLDDAVMREPYHAIGGLPVDEVPAFLAKVAEAAATAAKTAIAGLVARLGPLAAVGVVGGDRKVSTDFARIVARHAMQHQCDRALYEDAIIEGATRAGLSVTTLPATGALFDEASRVLGVALEPALAAAGKAIGSPWGKPYKEATAAALVALRGS